MNIKVIFMRNKENKHLGIEIDPTKKSRPTAIAKGGIFTFFYFSPCSLPLARGRRRVSIAVLYSSSAASRALATGGILPSTGLGKQ